MNKAVAFEQITQSVLCRVSVTALSAVLLTMLGLVAVSPAYSQVSSQSQIADTAENATGLDEVLVTARRRLENIQNVPGAISVVSAEALERSYAVNTQSIATLIPTLNYNSANPRNTAFTIRGLGSSVVAVAQANDGLESGVGFYIDQVYAARPAAAAFDFSDIERVEVLRGPQGTVFGKNTTAGAIQVISKEPSFKTGASGEVSFGSYNFFQAKAAVNEVLVDNKAAARLSGYLTRRDGVIRNILTGADLNNVHNDALRGQVLLTPTENFKFRVIGDWSNFDAECCVQVFYKVGTTLRPASRQFDALAAGINYRLPSRNPYDRFSDIDASVLVDTSQGGVTGIADWQTAGLTVTSVTAWRYWHWTAANDRDYTSVRVQLVQRIPSTQNQYSQELRLATNTDGPFSAVGGLYYFHQKLVGKPETVYGADATYWLLGTGPNFPAALLDRYGSLGDTEFRATSYAAFAEGTYDLRENIKLTFGLRYTKENKNGVYATRVSGGLANPTPAQLASQLSILRPQSYSASDEDGSLSGRTNLSVNLADDIMAYVSAARGFKSGGINMAGLPLDPQNQPALPTAVIKPERNTTYETGIKSQFLDRLTVNLAAYKTDVKDFHANVVDTGPGALRGYLANIPKVHVSGAELDTALVVMDWLNLRGGVAYTESKYASYRNGPCPLELIAGGTQVCDLTGRPLPNTPKWVANLGVNVDRSLADVGLPGSILVNIDSTSRTKVSGDGPASRDAFLNGYTLVNASVGYRSANGWDVRVFARNILNSDYMQNATIQAGNSGLIFGTPSDPRLFGITVRITM